MMKLFRRPFFTLLELLIVLFILSLVAVVTGIKMKEAYEEQVFLSEVEQIIDHLQMAQDLMLILDADVYFTLTKKKDQTVAYQLEVEKPLVIKKIGSSAAQDEDNPSPLDPVLSQKWTQLVERSISLRAIKAFEWLEGEEQESSLVKIGEESDRTDEKKIKLRFSLMKMSCGQLLFSSSSNWQFGQEGSDQVQKINLMGYPCSIRHSNKLLHGQESRAEESRRLYPKFE